MFNLDAELEWIEGNEYQPSTRMLAQITRQADSLRAEMARHGVRVRPITTDPPESIPAGSPVDCWSPTPRALAQLQALGAEPPPAPPNDVLQRVNHRAFGYGLGFLLPHAAFVSTESEAWRVLDRAPDQEWLLKRPFGFSGRMRKILRPSLATDADRRWIEESMRGYGIGLAIEPLVERIADFSLHGHLAANGGLRSGRVVRLLEDGARRGHWAGHEPAQEDQLVTEERRMLHDALGRVAHALQSEGYFGPFGIDAFRWRDHRGTTHFHPLVEVNARYTMAWWCGMRAPRKPR